MRISKIIKIIIIIAIIIMKEIIIIIKILIIIETTIMIDIIIMILAQNIKKKNVTIKMMIILKKKFNQEIKNDVFEEDTKMIISSCLQEYNKDNNANNNKDYEEVINNI